MSEKRQIPEFRYLANELTEFREHASRDIPARIIEGSEFRSWKLAGRAALAMVTDVADGFFGRRSNIRSPEYGRRDEQADKSLYRNIMLALAVKTGDSRYVAYAGLAGARNKVVESTRADLRARGLSADARPFGKFKTLVQNAGILLDLSPVGEAHSKFVHAIHMGGVAMSVASGVDIYRQAKQELAAPQPIFAEQSVAYFQADAFPAAA